jgi:hypothetical protein
MRSSVNYLGLACTGALLLACASGARQAAAPVARPSLATADSFYLLGRSEHQAQRLEAARGAYLQALQLAPGHVNAGNGLAVLHAAQGDYPQAIALWRGLSGAGGSSPESAFLYSNLGYAYFLAGELEPALAALEKACLLDPLSPFAWRHLGEVLEKLGRDERAALMFRQAQSLQEHDARADYVLMRREGAPLATSQAWPAAASAASVGARPEAMARTEVTPIGAGQVRVQRVAAADQTVSGEVHSVSVDVTHGGPLVRLEIRNGNGVTGMAAAAARIVGDARLRVIRLANEDNFQVALTRIEYGAEQERAARALAQRLGASATVAQSSCRPADLRLVLGRDLSDVGALRRRYRKSAPPDKLG